MTVFFSFFISAILCLSNCSSIVFLSLYLYVLLVSLSIFGGDRLFLTLSVQLSVCLFICLSLYACFLSFSLYFNLSGSLCLFLSVCLSIYLSVILCNLNVFLSICLFVCLSNDPFNFWRRQTLVWVWVIRTDELITPHFIPPNHSMTFARHLACYL
jgi:hypothetical protein